MESKIWANFFFGGAFPSLKVEQRSWFSAQTFLNYRSFTSRKRIAERLAETLKFWRNSRRVAATAGKSCQPCWIIRELKQTRTATATRGARKGLFPYFWRLWNSAYSYRGSNFLCFCRSFCCLIVSNYRRATVVVSQNDAPVLTTTQKWSNWSRTWGTTTPRSCQFHIFTCSFCLLQLV